MAENKKQIFSLALVGVIFSISIFYQTEKASSYFMESAINKPTVEECMEMMGASQEECEEMMSSFTAENYSASPDLQGNGVFGSKMNSSDIGQARQKREQDFAKIEKRAEQLIDFLKSQGIETEPLRQSLEIFNQKSQAVLVEFDELFVYFEETEENATQLDQEIVDQRQLAIKTKTQEVVDFFRTTLRENAQALTDAIQ